MSRKTGKGFLLSILFLAVLALMAGCGKEKLKGTVYQIYYMSLNEDEISARDVGIEDEGLEPQEIAEKMLEYMGKEPDDTKLRHLLAEDLMEPGTYCGKGIMTLDFPKAYEGLNPTQEVLTRAALVKTFTQIEGITSVRILVEGLPLKTQSGVVVGIMQADDFIDNPGTQINSGMEDTISLYFADAAGTGLVKLDRTIHYSTNVSMEKIIVQQLIDGPRSTLAQATIPRSTNIINVTVANGICYVNLNEAFINDQNNDIQEQVILYSIVNSLTELDAVDKVQISINGETNGKLRLQYELSTVYSGDQSIVTEVQSEGRQAEGQADVGEPTGTPDLQTGGLTE